LGSPPEQLPVPELRVTVQIAVAPSLTVTVPVGVPLPGATDETVAVKDTGWPTREGAGPDEVRPVVVAAELTFWVSVEDVLVPLLASPL
jgi:hypothetical protein